MPARRRFVLASASPRRRRLLEGLGLDFEVRPVEVDETPRPGEPAAEYVLRLARAKAAARAAPGELILAADTTVVLDGELLGKPEGPAGARSMLGRLAGRAHEVVSGVALFEPGARREETALESTRVEMAPMSDEEIGWYVATGEPLDKAGAYAVQGLGALFVDAVRGSWSNVVGLPIAATYRLFARLGHDLRTFRSDAPSRRT